METNLVDLYNLMAIVVLEYFGNIRPSEEEISAVENMLKRNMIHSKVEWHFQKPLALLAAVEGAVTRD